MNTHHRIAVVGAGLGGLTLARVLHVNGIEAAVYDQEASRDVRHQGGMLDIHEESGQAALSAAGLLADFRRLVLPGGQATRVLDQHAEVRMAQEDDGTGTRPEVERGQLRDLLLDALPEGTVRWGAKAAGVRTLDDGRHEVTLADGAVFTADLLVGADGAWSRVRPLVSDALPTYTGFSMVEVNLRDADTRHPASASVVGGGVLFALGAGKGFLAHRESDGCLHTYATLEVPENWVTTIDFSDTATAKEAVLALFPDWDPSLRALVADADGALVPRAIHALPVGHRWERVPGVTLLGDAAHLMSPFAGEGANLAMIDAADLGLALAASPDGTEGALAAYERGMFPRAEAAAADSAAGLALCFADDAPRGLLEMFASA
ncbi:FAD-dependent oxidoreductase [Streptomyces sp. NPDC012623]|uniref:FAD-dependent oxidoreductase n=1 Tax=unclassified Streptomyces TaxID=2593676 RepID=UPI0036B745C0